MYINPSKKFKYITTLDTAIIFNELLQHKEFKHFNPETAGFCQILYNVDSQRYEATCFGESISLELKADPEIDKFKTERILNNLI